jgi:hypothetical protein
VCSYQSGKDKLPLRKVRLLTGDWRRGERVLDCIRLVLYEITYASKNKRPNLLWCLCLAGKSKKIPSKVLNKVRDFPLFGDYVCDRGNRPFVW